MYASRAVVEERSNSRNSASTSWLTDVGRSRKARDMARSCSGWRNEKSSEIATDSAPESRTARATRPISVFEGRTRTRPLASTRSRKPKHRSLGTGAGGRVIRRSYSEGRSCLAMVNRSSNPAVVMNAVRAPLRSRIAFVATVVPWDMPAAPSCPIPARTASAGSFGFPKVRARRDRAPLVRRPRLDESVVEQDAQRRGGPMVPQPAGVDPRRHEGVAQGVHLHERRHLAGVAEVVLVLALGHRWHRFRLDRDEARLGPAMYPFADRRIREAREVRASPDAAHHVVRRHVGELELFPHFESDDRLVHEDVVQDAAQGVLRIRPGHRGLDRLGNRDAEGPGMVWVGGEELLPDVRPVTRARNDLGPEELHQVFPIRLLVVRNADHEDF